MERNNLAILRNKKDISQRELAKILKVSKSTYARWETQEEIIPLWHLINFCNYFKVSMDYVLGLSLNNNFSKYDYNKKIDKSIIGNNIKLLRKKNNLTQFDLAKTLNTSQSTISAYENGKSIVLTVFIYSLAQQFNTSIDKLCGLEKIKVDNK